MTQGASHEGNFHGPKKRRKSKANQQSRRKHHRRIFQHPAIGLDAAADELLNRPVSADSSVKWGTVLCQQFLLSVDRYVREAAVIPRFDITNEDAGRAIGKNRGCAFRIFQGQQAVELGMAFVWDRAGVLDLQEELVRFRRTTRAQIRAIGLQKAIEQAYLLLNSGKYPDGVGKGEDFIDLEASALLWAAVEEIVGQAAPCAGGEFPVRVLEGTGVLDRILARMRDALEGEEGVAEVDYEDDRLGFVRRLLAEYGYAAYLANRATVRMCPKHT